METIHRRRVDEIREQLVAEMKQIRADRSFASFLFVVEDIVHGQTEILIVGVEQQVAEAFGQDLSAPHSITLGGIMSRKEQVIPALPVLRNGGGLAASRLPGNLVRKENRTPIS
jgi:inorganic pyrophosphatase/exopolyphosphatase